VDADRELGGVRRVRVRIVPFEDGVEGRAATTPEIELGNDPPRSSALSAPAAERGSFP